MAKFTRYDPRNKKQQKKHNTTSDHRKMKHYENEDDIPNVLLSKLATEQFNNGDRSARK